MYVLSLSFDNVQKMTMALLYAGMFCRGSVLRLVRVRGLIYKDRKTRLHTQTNLFACGEWSTKFARAEWQLAKRDCKPRSCNQDRTLSQEVRTTSTTENYFMCHSLKLPACLKSPLQPLIRPPPKGIYVLLPLWRQHRPFRRIHYLHPLDKWRWKILPLMAH